MNEYSLFLDIYTYRIKYVFLFMAFDLALEIE
jgi:hypothetical protein